MIADILTIIAMILLFEIWLPLAFIFGFIKLVTSFSLVAAWEAFKSVPVWIWDFINSALS